MNNLTDHYWSKPIPQLPKDESVAEPTTLTAATRELSLSKLSRTLQTHRLRTQNQPSEESEAKIIERMVEYMKEFLEKPHQVFQGLPICPFARKARLDNQILYKVHRFTSTPDLREMEMIQEFCQEQRYEVLLVMHPEKQALTQLQMQEFIEKLNAKIAPTGLVAFGGHPEQDFQIQGIHTRQEPYLNFTVQFQQRLKDASDLLLRTTSYYQNWTAENLRDVGIPRESNCS